MGNKASRKAKKGSSGVGSVPSEQGPETLKLLVVGDANVGKTSLVQRLCERTFPEEHTATLGVDFKTFEFGNGDQRVKLQMWDTAGEERFRDFTTAYYKSAQAVIIVYDVTNSLSFQHIDEWLSVIEKHAKHVKKILLGNKVDLLSQREVTREEGEEFANKRNIFFLESSAKDEDGVSTVFTSIVEYLSSSSSQPTSSSSSSSLSQP